MSNHKNKQAIVFLTDNNFLQGFKVLYQSLNEHNQKLLSEIDKILIVDADVDITEFKNEFIVRVIDPKEYEGLKLDKRYPHWYKTFYKLEIFSIQGYDRIVFMESDILCKGDISYLFDKESSAEILGVLHVNKVWISPGVLVLNNGIEKLDLKKLLIAQASKICYDGDSRLINEYILENQHIHTELLPIEYNFAITFQNHWEDADLNNIRLLHFSGGAKPWTNKRIAAFYQEYNNYL